MLSRNQNNYIANYPLKENPPRNKKKIISPVLERENLSVKNQSCAINYNKQSILMPPLKMQLSKRKTFSFLKVLSIKIKAIHGKITTVRSNTLLFLG